MKKERNPLRETVAALLREEHTEFLHDPDPMYDHEGQMAKSRIREMISMLSKLDGALHDEDQLPAWVQDHMTVAYEKVHDAFSYMSTKFDGGKGEDLGYEDEEDDEED